MAIYGETAQKHFLEIKSLLDSQDWEEWKTKKEITAKQHKLNNLAINCFMAEGYTKKTARKMADHFAGMSNEDFIKVNPDIKERWYISEEPPVIYQVNKLPWPVSSRDMVMEFGRFTDESGGEYCVFKSIDHPDAPHPGKNVRCNVLVSGFLFLPAKHGGTRVIRILQVDPAGSIPAAVVNALANTIFTEVQRLYDFGEEEEEEKTSRA